MKFNNRQYPHPVLGMGEDESKDVNGLIEVDLKVSSTGTEIEISPTFRISNNGLQSLIDNNIVVYVAHLYCRGTMYRDVFKSNKNVFDAIKIDSYRLNDEVEMDFFVCANENIHSYKNQDFNSDYDGLSFAIDKGDILAYAGKGKFYANKSPEELKSISALMNIDTTGDNNHPMKLNYSGEKITILLCQAEYENYQIVKGNQISINILLSCVVLPALVEAFHFVSSEESAEFNDRRWYKFLTDHKDKSKYGSPLEMAQGILQLPNNRSFETVIKLID